ncbi:helix-turn-helix domain-containing protein [Streptomyces canus]|uniref:helix-turn-helix domain-containing protein n=1 Tax=Streptomyces canus TaxID=58343 RepID=UPI003868CC1B
MHGGQRLVLTHQATRVIDERVTLEAKRRLAHSDETAVRIAAHLGFSSATNFSKYFQSRTGQSPIQFRNAARQVLHPRGGA